MTAQRVESPIRSTINASCRPPSHDCGGPLHWAPGACEAEGSAEAAPVTRSTHPLPRWSGDLLNATNSTRLVVMHRRFRIVHNGR